MQGTRAAFAFAVVVSTTLVGASAPSASPQAADACSARALRVVIAGRQRCLDRGVACRARLNSGYHRYYFHCTGGYLVYWWSGLVRRPLHLPTLTAGSACPAAGQNGTLRDHGGLDLPTAPAFGPGPAYPTLGSDSGKALLTYGGGFSSYEGWEGSKVLWTVPHYNGPYIVRGRHLEGDQNELKFDQGPNWSNRLHAELRFVGPYPRLNPAATYLRAPGCYAYQVEGRGFSYLIVFEARLGSSS
jgi:hypothetical protein